jgi:hypothetical protein
MAIRLSHCTSTFNIMYTAKSYGTARHSKFHLYVGIYHKTYMGNARTVRTKIRRYKHEA